jgi:hypothetical protein
MDQYRSPTSVFRDWDLAGDGTWVTQEFVFILKKSVDSKSNDCNVMDYFYGVTIKINNIKTRIS